MNDQKGPYVVEHHVTWAILSDGNVITMGHPMLNQYPGQTSQAPKQPAGPRKILRREFDEMPHEDRWKAVREGAQIVDSLQVKATAPAPRQAPAITRAAFDAMSRSEKDAALKDIRNGDARLID